jgi:hypothetical protein
MTRRTATGSSRGKSRAASERRRHTATPGYVAPMSKEQRPAIELNDEARNRLQAAWSRSGKRLLVTVYRRGRWDEAAQIELDGEQVGELQAFLAETRASQS